MAQVTTLRIHAQTLEKGFEAELEAMPEDEVVDLKPIPLAHGHRIHGLSLPEAAAGVGPPGAFGGA